MTGFQHDDLKDLIQQLDIPAEAQDDDFEPDEAAEKIGVPITRAGDIWQLGRHRLMCGDATALEDVERLTIYTTKSAARVGTEKALHKISDTEYVITYQDNDKDA
ncbi:hypothetical protein D7X25_08975, partial [bacterium 1XD42-8]